MRRFSSLAGFQKEGCWVHMLACLHQEVESVRVFYVSSVITAEGLSKGGVFGPPTPFAILAVNGERAYMIVVVKRTIVRSLGRSPSLVSL
ncbi:hypothetical protein P691DRAFT_36738 [Macrolepiota fuliginosa MF-IS2]|uniref:Uncharacterized protein n=1 Tax=Macrolepiota fuliginosa MF-IS2 TaxID=1400762 RepID=A0A9P5WYU7_9AGAR|nr:hypothetical protein P691DRAFT_36738 [Macrolepiota fuliginosa MF-IS2]